MRGARAVTAGPLPPVPALADSRAETVLPSAAPPSIVAAVFGHRPRRCVQRSVSRREIQAHGQSCLDVRVDGKTCQLGA